MPTQPGPSPRPEQPERIGVVIAAAGKSRRMGSSNKVFAPILGKPLLAYGLDAFEQSLAVTAIVVVFRPDQVEQGHDFLKANAWSKVMGVATGGARRQDSVRAGLDALGDCDWVMVHDAARPCVTVEIIERGLTAARETGGAIAAVPAKDTIKIVGTDNTVVETPVRESLWLVQTPQVFRWDIIRTAYARVTDDVTDDASMVEKMGHQVKVFMGAYDNIKVTTPEDLAVAEAFLRRFDA